LPKRSASCWVLGSHTLRPIPICPSRCWRPRPMCRCSIGKRQLCPIITPQPITLRPFPGAAPPATAPIAGVRRCNISPGSPTLTKPSSTTTSPTTPTISAGSTMWSRRRSWWPETPTLGRLCRLPCFRVSPYHYPSRRPMSDWPRQTWVDQIFCRLPKECRS